MNPDAAAQAAQAYEREADEVDRLVQKADALARVEGLGEYGSAQQLAAGGGGIILTVSNKGDKQLIRALNR
ncbi:hypothetical protein [Saccharopolyspora pogona]|uniref:hypothetical protein n=1 Tax=Saccharopolyspora pogona TaxID=333966 RepID=UPI001CC25EAA|nr:hypothetical protein [Saccharopolyspora pogona]